MQFSLPNRARKEAFKEAFESGGRFLTGAVRYFGAELCWKFHLPVCYPA